MRIWYNASDTNTNKDVIGHVVVGVIVAVPRAKTDTQIHRYTGTHRLNTAATVCLGSLPRMPSHSIPGAGGSAVFPFRVLLRQ